eukprot:7260846-Heterocapsa_arctica.AAC.1
MARSAQRSPSGSDSPALQPRLVVEDAVEALPPRHTFARRAHDEHVGLADHHVVPHDGALVGVVEVEVAQ